MTKPNLASDPAPGLAVAYADPALDDEDTLVDLLDRLLDKGIVAAGDLRLSIADVDLIFVGLKLFVSSVDTIEDMREGPTPAPERL